MKKILQTCFLIQLCLFGSNLTALSKVVQSPGAYSLHRLVGPSRGGETLSDTFHQTDFLPDLQKVANSETKETNLKTSDSESLGSPVLSTLPTRVGKFEACILYLTSLDSLVDRYLDSGAGEEATRLQPAPVTVFSDHAQMDDDANRISHESQSLDSCFLCLDSITQSGSDMPAVILVETMSVAPIDSLEFRIWDPYLNELDVPKPYIEIAPLTAGSVFVGSWGAKTVQWTSPPLSGYARISIRNGPFKYLDRFLVEPGDSVRIRFDFQTAKVLFSGPAAEKFRSQYELAQAIESERYQQSPIMFTRTSDYWGHSPEDSVRIAKAKASKSSIHRTMEYVSTGESGLNHLRRELSGDINQHAAWEVLDDFRDKLPHEFWEILKADVYGKLKYDQISDFLYLRYGLDTTAAYRALYQEKILNDELLIPEGASWSVYYPDYLYQRLAIISHMEKQPVVSLLTSIPESVRDPVYAKYLIKNFRTFKDSNFQFEQALEIIQTPWINELIGSLYHSQKIGSPLASIPLTTVKGDSVFLNGDDGKIRFIQFWLPGCQASASYYTRLLAPVVEHYKEDPNVEFVFISNDPLHERWLENISAETYSSKESLNLNAPGKTHPFLMYYHIHAFPEQMVIGRDGGVVNLGNIPKTPQSLIEYLDSLKESGSSTNQPLVK